MAIKLLDSRGVKDKLYQWDKSRQVVLDGDDAKATRVDFAHYRTDDEALAVETREFQGMVIADIPNNLLQSSEDIVCYSVYETIVETDEEPECECEKCGENVYSIAETISEARLNVISRNMPPDYFYTPTQVIGWQTMKAWVKEQLDNLQISMANDYMSLENKPSIEGVTLEGEKKMAEFGVIQTTDEDIDGLFKS